MPAASLIRRNSMLKLYMGGSPCTHWSIAQTKNRETEPSGLGWELFRNYLIGLEKYRPDYFLYENNKSMAPAIRAQITKELGVEPILINSALVSAQNRQRLYWTNIPAITQPADKGIILADVLESGVCWNEKAYCLTATEHKGSSLEHTLQKHARTQIAEPVRIGTIESLAKNADFDSQQYRVYSPEGKAVTLCGNGGGVGAKTGLYAVPCCVAQRGLYADTMSRAVKSDAPIVQVYEPRGDSKTNTLTTVQKDNMVIEYAEPYTVWTDNGLTATTKINNKIVSLPVYEVKNGQITIKGNTYPIKLPDGLYIIRKLTVTECKRLQTVPDDYIFPVSNTQAYKMLGNGWTVDVIAHILSHVPGITTEPVEVLSMYDGMSCGHIALDKLGVDVARYYATEVDKYAIKTTLHNYPDTVQLGDAFQVRDADWRIL